MSIPETPDQPDKGIILLRYFLKVMLRGWGIRCLLIEPIPEREEVTT